MKKVAKVVVVQAALISLVSQSFPAMADDAPKPNQFWWPKQIDLTPLRVQAPQSNPYGDNFDYKKEFESLDLAAVKADIKEVLTKSQDWWPADYGHYGPFFIRMAWHGAGTYRVFDGRGGAGGAQQRFEPLNSWPDNVSLDKARRLVWPVKKKYGRKLSWGDLMVLTGNVSLESMGFKTFGFAGGRSDDWEADLIYWGPGDEFLSSNRDKKSSTLEQPLAATQMGLIYVNPEGPNGNPDPIAAAKDIKEAFGRMAMDDEETVALIAGGHTFGKAHGAAPATNLGPAPAGESMDKQGFGWCNKFGTGTGKDAITSGLEGAWSQDPIGFTSQYFDNLFAFDWVLTKSPAGANQWKPKDAAAQELVPDAFDKSKKHPPMMFTTDLSLKFDPTYAKISKHFQENPEAFKLAFAKAWFKLTHRDMGPRSRYLGPEVPKEAMIWQDPLPEATYKMIDQSDISKLKSSILSAGLSNSELIKAAWGSAASFRRTDKRGGANGARVRLNPAMNWQANDPGELSKVLAALSKIQTDFNAQNTGKKVSMADLIVLGGGAAIEQAGKKAGYSLNVPFSPGRTDATQEKTDIESYNMLEPKADGFRNYYAKGNQKTPAQMLIERASFLDLSVPEMTVLVGGLRALDANHAHSKLGVLTDRPGTLSNDFFVNLLDMSTSWSKSGSDEYVFEGKDRKSGALKWTASQVDLVFGSNAELRAVAEVYASDDAKDKFAQDFVTAWAKVMNNDRFDLR